MTNESINLETMEAARRTLAVVAPGAPACTPRASAAAALSLGLPGWDGEPPRRDTPGRGERGGAEAEEGRSSPRRPRGSLRQGEGFGTRMRRDGLWARR